MKTAIIIGCMLLMGVLGYMAGSIFTYKRLKPLQMEYQIKLELDAAYIYDDGKLIGITPYGKDGIDSVILNDNL